MRFLTNQSPCKRNDFRSDTDKGANQPLNFKIMKTAFKKLEEARQVLKPFSKKTKQELILELNNEFNGNLTHMADNYNRTIDELLNAMKTYKKNKQNENFNDQHKRNFENFKQQSKAYFHNPHKLRKVQNFTI